MGICELEGRKQDVIGEQWSRGVCKDTVVLEGPFPGPGAPEAAVPASLPQAQPPPLPTSSPTVTAKNRKSNSMTLGGNQTKVHESVIDPSPGLGLLPSRKLTLDKSKVLQE